MRLLDAILPVRPKAATRTTGGILSDPPDWLSRLFGGGLTESGVPMNEHLALNLSAVYNAVTILAGAMKISPVKMYRSRSDGGKDRVNNHPVGRLVSKRPNPDMPASRFWSFAQAWRVLWGNFYAERETNRRNEVVALWPLESWRVAARREPDGTILYTIDGKETVGRDRMFHVPGILSKDGFTGISVVASARESMAMAAAAELYGSRFFKNGAAPSGFIKRPLEAPEMDEEGERNLLDSLMRSHSGANQHMPGILHEGAEWQQVGIPNQDAQFLETRTFQVVEIARWFNIPPHKLKELSRATFSNIEHQAIEYLTDCLGPHYVDFQDAMNLALLPERDQDEFFFEFDVRGIMWADHKARSEFYKALFEMGVLSVNEIRALENMNPIGADGDLRFVPGNNLTPLGQARQKAETPPADSEEADAVAFKRDVVKAFIADGTVSDVIANATRIDQLVGDSGLPVNDEYVEPYLPVLADNGEPVSGEVVRDQAGDIVGGDTLEPEPDDDPEPPEGPAGDAGGELGGSPPEEPEGDDEGDGGQDAAGPDLEAVRAALMPVFAAVADRLARKERRALERAAGKHAKDAGAFAEWAEKFYGELAGETAAEFEPAAAALARLIGRDPQAAGTRLPRIAATLTEAAWAAAMEAYATGGAGGVSGGLDWAARPATSGLAVMEALTVLSVDS